MTEVVKTPLYGTEPIGVICPIYGYEMSKMVQSFLAEAVFNTNFSILC